MLLLTTTFLFKRFEELYAMASWIDSSMKMSMDYRVYCDPMVYVSRSDKTHVMCIYCTFVIYLKKTKLNFNVQWFINSYKINNITKKGTYLIKREGTNSRLSAVLLVTKSSN